MRSLMCLIIAERFCISSSEEQCNSPGLKYLMSSPMLSVSHVSLLGNYLKAFIRVSSSAEAFKIDDIEPS